MTEKELHKHEKDPSMQCRRCNGLMRAAELRDWESAEGQDRSQALSCIACGEIVDAVIIRNRLGSRAERPHAKNTGARHNAPGLRLRGEPPGGLLRLPRFISSCEGEESPL
jgi:hypothetical protein